MTTLPVTSIVRAACGRVTALALLLGAEALIDPLLTANPFPGPAAHGEAAVTLLVATRPGQAEAVSAELTQLGSTLEYSDAHLGYLRVRVPATRLEAAVAVAGIATMDRDGLRLLDSPRRGRGRLEPGRHAPPAAPTKEVHPFSSPILLHQAD